MGRWGYEAMGTDLSRSRRLVATIASLPDRLIAPLPHRLIAPSRLIAPLPHRPIVPRSPIAVPSLIAPIRASVAERARPHRIGDIEDHAEHAVGEVVPLRRNRIEAPPV